MNKFVKPNQNINGRNGLLFFYFVKPHQNIILGFVIKNNLWKLEKRTEYCLRMVPWNYKK